MLCGIVGTIYIFKRLSLWQLIITIIITITRVSIGYSAWPSSRRLMRCTSSRGYGRWARRLQLQRTDDTHTHTQMPSTTISSPLAKRRTKVIKTKLDNCNCHGQLPGFTIMNVRMMLCIVNVQNCNHGRQSIRDRGDASPPKFVLGGHQLHCPPQSWVTIPATSLFLTLDICVNYIHCCQ